jgi:mRNA interferase MazF
MRRGDIYRVRQPPRGDPKKSRCFVVVSRQTLLDSKANRVVCAPVNSTDAGLATEVHIGVAEGLKHPSCINCDQLTRLEKGVLTDFVGALSAKQLRALHGALVVALDLD